MAVGRSRDHSQGDALRIDCHRAFDALLSPVYRAPASLLTPARSFGDATIDGHLSRIEADDSVIGFARHLLQSVHHPRFYPLVAPPSQCGGRALLVGDPPVSAAEHQDLDELLEDDPVGDARAMTAQGVVCLPGGQQSDKLVPYGLDDVWWQGGHGTCSFSSGSLEDSPHDRASVSAFHVGALRTYWRSLLFSRTRGSRYLALPVIAISPRPTNQCC